MDIPDRADAPPRPLPQPRTQGTSPPLPAGSPPLSGASRRRSGASANHLLRFTAYTPPPSSQTARPPRPPSTLQLSPAQQRLRKEQFLHARYRFLLLDAAALELPARGARADPDALPPWSDVVAVEQLEPAPLACPVCFEEGAALVAPQITACGHAFCLPCLARHAATAQRAPTCPLCALPFRLADLRRLVHSPAPAVTRGQRCAFVLLQRSRSCLVPALVGAEALPSRWPAASDGRCSLWSKLSVTAGEGGVTEGDAAALEAATACADDASLPALLAAGNALRARGAAWAERRLALQDTYGAFPTISPPLPADADAGEPWFFYAAADGCGAVLHPCTAKALLGHAGGVRSSLPRRVEATVLEVECGTVTPEARQRMKHLGHLPLGSPLVLVELALEDLNLSPEALAAAAPDAAARARRRAAAAAAEQAADARAARAAAASEAAAAAAAIARAEAQAATLARNMPPLRPVAAAEVAPPAEEAVAPDPPPQQPAGVSFARVAGMGYASGLNAPPPLGTSPPPASAWGPALGAPAPAPPAWGARAVKGDAALATPGEGKGKKKGTLLFAAASRRQY